MNYEEFLDMPSTFYDDMVNVLNIKHKYRLEFTEQEKKINQHIMTYAEEMEINALRTRFERCYSTEPKAINPGDKIKYVGCTKEQIKSTDSDDPYHLIIGYEYTVESVDICDRYTKIKLKNKIGWFNSDCFQSSP